MIFATATARGAAAVARPVITTKVRAICFGRYYHRAELKGGVCVLYVYVCVCKGGKSVNAATRD